MLSWLIEAKLSESGDIDNYAKNNNLKTWDVWHNDKLIEQLAEKYVNVYGLGPHDCDRNTISVGDKIVYGMACGNVSVLSRGIVAAIDIDKQKVKIEQTHSNEHEIANPKAKWYSYTNRMMIVV